MILAGALALAAIPASAQLGFDIWGPIRDVSLSNATVAITASGSSATLTTNNAILLRLFDGIAVVDYFIATNNGANVGYVIPQTSPDTTNWYNLSNYTTGVAASISTTNYYYTSNGIITTNVYQLPGYVTTVTASTSGWANPYVASAPFTNYGPLTNTGQFAIAFKLGDQYPYFRTIFSTVGTNSYGGTLHARLKE